MQPFFASKIRFYKSVYCSISELQLFSSGGFCGIMTGSFAAITVREFIHDNRSEKNHIHIHYHFRRFRRKQERHSAQPVQPVSGGSADDDYHALHGTGIHHLHRAYRGHSENHYADDSVCCSLVCDIRISILDSLYQNPETERSSRCRCLHGRHHDDQ